jgi:hypothetical protein
MIRAATTNVGTTEHVGDQMNAFRSVHDFAKPGAIMYHSVPALGYFNHGLFSYSPVFFLFLAEANGYEIEALNISPPHLPHTLNQDDAISGTTLWRYVVVQSGIINVVLRKTCSASFAVLTDHDATRSEATRKLPEKWLATLRDRYDLRVR